MDREEWRVYVSDVKTDLPAKIWTWDLSNTEQNILAATFCKVDLNSGITASFVKCEVSPKTHVYPLQPLSE
jgi:hypothetical protein